MASSRFSSYCEPASGGEGGGVSIGVSGGKNELVDPESLYTKQSQIGVLPQLETQ
jgi:hypothetical protein